MDIFITTLSIAGSVASIYSIYYVFFESKKIETWKAVEAGINLLRKKIREKNHEPDLVVCLGMGGSIVGSLLTATFERKPIISIDRRYEWVNGHRKTYVDTPKDLKLNFSPQKVLLVTGEIYEGDAISLACDFVKEKIGGTIQTVSMYVSENSSYFPDHYPYLVKKRVNPPWRLKNSKRDSKLD